MGADIQVTEYECTALWKEWYVSARALGFGEVPGKYSEEQLQKSYDAILIGLEGFEGQSLYQRRRQSAHVLQHFLILEFEVSSQSLFTRFPPEVLRGMTKKQYHNLFLRYSAEHPETILARENREKVIGRMNAVRIIRREWYQ